MALTTRELDNDARGWIMAAVSGVACIFGAAIVCVDLAVRQFPGKRDFRIQDSNIFLACSLSLSFGVMIFSSLYSMLPESKSYLKHAELSDQAAGLIVVACFAAGFFGIQVVSRLLHHFMPSHVVDCDHSHADGASQIGHSTTHNHKHSSRRQSSRQPSAKISASAPNGHSHAVETTPLLESERNGRPRVSKRHASARGGDMVQRPVSPLMASRARATTGGVPTVTRRRSMIRVQERVMSFVKDKKTNCDESGSCYGYTDPCGQECFKHLTSRTTNSSRHPTLLRTTTGSFYGPSNSPFHGGHEDEGEPYDRSVSPKFRTSRATSREPLQTQQEEDEHNPDCHCESEDEGSGSQCSTTEEDKDVEAQQHHHHVPTNAFLSIGLQTSIAIALHKFPEGFITYATNHANPILGFNVFMALFVHNITEGFAMCLPLYMALGSRVRAIAWSALLGGMSQPVGAGIAVLWFKVTRDTNMAPNETAYGCIFAATAGIMVSVALQLFVEALSMNHNRNLCIFFAFIGMSLLSLSNAFFAGH
ncbi:hypothetical protein S7711_07196 [Stachybotrys chartarum IBT 7711]|uniref:Uncharacterized protein n=1 Tax=Stachybotrys chartarum (strain CBS 109288 / IBT 7711) TaxID=1280523 RepID=A0A084AKI5_STACB|nr:hypothetical protein S7711_07196 [Stachybotrys chartarum IBT 7711]KFA55812.1 hypothetical protein S40293_01927 [Stachybotrys chartarum IBT 40293]KFA79577.1 hypothetical protein S40288_01086 [Stachybotrys chartarum IBT 40288]